MSSHWLADRTRLYDASGIRKVFDLGAKLTDPINLSIGQPDFETPEPVRRAAIEAIEGRKNGYALSQGMPVLREKLQGEVDREFGHADREVFVTSGTSGGIMLAMLVLLNPGEEVIVFDPYFVMYDALAAVAGAKVVFVDTYPDFRTRPRPRGGGDHAADQNDRLQQPGQPDRRRWPSEAEVRGIAQLAAEKNIVLLSDEIYRHFCYDGPFVSPAKFNPQTLVVDGFSKTYAIPGWRLGFAHGPAAIIQEMIKLQQYSFVCAPQPAQWAGAAAMDVDVQPYIDAYRRKRDMLVEGLRRSLRPDCTGRGVLPLSPLALGQRHGVRRPRHREAPVARHSRQRFQPPRHAFPHFLRGVRRDARARHRGAEGSWRRTSRVGPDRAASAGPPRMNAYRK